MPIERVGVYQKIKQAYKAGMSAAAWIRQMRKEGLGYATQRMYQDWHSVVKIFEVEGALQHIRKDYYPTEKTIAEVYWQLSKEYMYKVRVYTRTRPDEPLKERFVNILSDKPLTPREIELAVEKKWSQWTDYTKEAIEKITAWTAYRRAEEV